MMGERFSGRFASEGLALGGVVNTNGEVPSNGPSNVPSNGPSNGPSNVPSNGPSGAPSSGRRGGGPLLPPGVAPARDLAADLSRIARDLEDEEGLDATLDAIVVAAVGAVPGAEHASISMVRGRREITSRAATSDLARRNDRAQYDAGEGPCLESLYERRTVHVHDMATETRWPVFSRRSSELGVRSMLSVQLFVTGDDLGALNLLSTAPGAFDAGSEHITLLFASHAAVAIVGAEQEEQLRDALAQRDVIGQAMGVLMERYAVSPTRAFALLTRVSQRNNVRLLELAGAIVGARGGGDRDADPEGEIRGLPGR